MRDEPHPNLGTKELDEADINILSDESLDKKDDYKRVSLMEI